VTAGVTEVIEAASRPLAKACVSQRK
jgi:hypothetical protein